MFMFVYIVSTHVYVMFLCLYSILACSCLCCVYEVFMHVYDSWFSHWNNLRKSCVVNVWITVLLYVRVLLLPGHWESFKVCCRLLHTLQVGRTLSLELQAGCISSCVTSYFLLLLETAAEFSFRSNLYPF